MCDMCVCMCMVAVWYSGCVLALSLIYLSSSPSLAIFHLVFHQPPTSPTSSPSCDSGEFAGVQIQGLFSWNRNGPDGVYGANTTCCEEKPVLLWFITRFQKLCLHSSPCMLSANAYWLCQACITSSTLQENYCMCAWLVPCDSTFLV